MGANRGSGRPPMDPGVTRSEPLRIMLRPAERDDLLTLAAAWDVPLSTACWALVATELGRIRGEKADLGAVEMALKATARTLVNAQGKTRQAEASVGRAYTEVKDSVAVKRSELE